ncbi:MAG: hypothetical protein JOZ48_17735 [Acidobacteriaceae bacterium]|nr:hypothetical protein [Acidobacteriaceae bacterium]
MLLRAASLTFLAVFLLNGQSTPSPSNSDQSSATAGQPETPPIVTCPAGGPLGALDLRVASPNNSETLPFRTINHLNEGYTVQYAPILRGREKRPGEVSLVMVPVKPDPNKDAVIVTDPKSAEKPYSWNITENISLAAFVYGPEGLSKKKVRNFLAQDNVLIAQLADYAEKTSQTEALVQALSNAESSPASVNAALNGFASQYGLAVQIDPTAPPAVQAQTLFSVMNPQLATYNPITPSTAANVGQTASVATAAATLFFGSPIGLAAGGTAMLLDLRAIAFPGTQFRSSFAEPLPTPKTGVNLCGPQNPAPLHTRVAYIWASRIPSTPPPSIQLGRANFIPVTQKSPVPVEVPEPQWKYLQRARAWELVNENGNKTAVKVLKLGNQKALEIDLTKLNLAPGNYHLAGYWDWDHFEALGEVHVRPLSDFEQAKLESSSQDKLLAKTGKIAATLSGADYEFTTKVEMKKLGDEFATAEPVRFILPKGLREGPQEHMDVQIDTGDLDPGQYQLLISQQDGKAHPVEFRILQNAPKIANLPILVNQGVATQHYVLKGERLALLSKLEAPGAVLDFGSETSSNTERPVTIELKSNPQPGTTIPITAHLSDRSEPLSFPDALQITGPLPVIASSKLSQPADLPVSIRPDEIPAGSTLSAMLDVKNMDRKSVLRLGCSDDGAPPVSLHIGEQTSTASLQQLSQDQLFVSSDTTALPAGCVLQAVIDSGRNGQSQPFTLARIVRLPQIDSFVMANEPAAANPAHAYVLTGRDLELIEKAGWTQNDGTEVAGLPVPIEGQKQQLRITLPDPPTPQTTLYIWLRGEKEARTTTIKSPALPTTPAAPANPSQPPPSPVGPANPPSTKVR